MLPIRRILGLHIALHRMAEPLALWLFFSLLTAMMFARVLPELGHCLLGPPEDNLQDLWNGWYFAEAPHPGGFFNTNLIRFPEGTTLYYHSFAYVQLAALALLRALLPGGISLIAIHNLTLLASFPLAGLGGYYLVRHVTASRIAGLIGGFVLAFNASHVEQAMHHAHVAAIGFIPFFMLCWIRASEKFQPSWIAAACLCNVLCALSCWYYLFYNGYFVIFHSVSVWLRERRRPALRELVAPASLAIASALALAPIILPMVRQAVGNVSVYAAGSDLCVADLAAYLAFAPFHLLSSLSEAVYPRLTGNEWEDTVYLGWVNLLLLGGLCCARPRWPFLPYLLAGMVTFAIIASGDNLHLMGHRLFVMPGSLLSSLPFFANVRTPLRAIVYVVPFLAIGVGQAAATLHRRARWTLPLLAILLLLDAFPAHLAVTPFDCAPELALIAEDPDQNAAVLDLPNFSPASFVSYVEGNYEMAQQTCHHHPIAQGNISRNLAVSLRDRLDLADPDDLRRQLIAAHVKYVILHRPLAAPFVWAGQSFFAWPADQPSAESLARLLTLRAEGPRMQILQVSD